MTESEKYAKNARNKPICRSCIMVEEQEHMDEFYELGVKKVGVYEVNGALVVDVPTDKVEGFVELYSRIMKPGYWNEYLGPKTGFFFKTQEGEFINYPLTPENEKLINKTMKKFLPNWSEDTDLWKWLAEVEIYYGWIKN